MAAIPISSKSNSFNTFSQQINWENFSGKVYTDLELHVHIFVNTWSVHTTRGMRKLRFFATALVDYLPDRISFSPDEFLATKILWKFSPDKVAVHCKSAELMVQQKPNWTKQGKLTGHMKSMMLHSFGHKTESLDTFCKRYYEGKLRPKALTYKFGGGENWFCLGPF